MAGPDQGGPSSEHGVTRRSFIRTAAGGAIAGAIGLPLLLDACGGTAAPASSAAGSTAPAGSAAASASVAAQASSAAASAAPSAAASAGGKVIAGINPVNAKALPTYFAPKLLAAPDYDAHDPRVTLGYNHYPKNPRKSWQGPPPG
ncbi:MAG: hypothetical protein ACRDHX_06765, partial [Chloroflexota bacterium]